MQNFEFYTPTHVFFGKGEEKKIGSIIESYGFKKVLIHFGGGSVKKNGLLDLVESQLTEHEIEFVELGGVQPNPLLSLVREGVELCKKEKVDMILAVGGGSVLDSSKSIAAGYANPEHDPWDYSSKKAVLTKTTPLGTILTLSASGSEMSDSCVITNGETAEKRGFNSPLNRPLFSVLNPELTFTVSPYQTACGTVDIMMHTLERYFCLNEDNDLADRLAEGLLFSVVQAGKKAMENPSDYEARATLMWAGSLSHNGLTGAGKNFMMQVHQMEHELSGWDDKIAHGAGLAVLWPEWARFQAKNATKRFAQYATRVWNAQMNEENPLETALEGIQKTQDFFISLGMPSKLREFGIQEEDLPALVKNVTFQNTRVLPDYVDLGEPEILEIFKAAF